MLTLIFFGLLLSVADTEALHNTHKYSAPRDYLSVTSENYPDTYPPDNSFTWQWTAKTGHWGVVFEDFDLAPMDTLKIFDPSNNKTVYYWRQNTPLDFSFGSDFSMTLKASRDPVDSNSRGFKCHVFYAKTREEVEFKMNARKGTRPPDKMDTDDSQPISGTVIALIVVIVVFVVAASVVFCVIKRRHQHQQTTNTSVHVNIDGIRRASAVSYTRTGGGGGGPRARLDSVDSMGPDNEATTPKRPVTRSESNASWAERANSVRNGSCSSAGDSNRGGRGGGEGAGRGCSSTVQHNFYTLHPMLDPDDHQDDKGEKGAETFKSSLRQDSQGFTAHCRNLPTTRGRSRSAGGSLSSIFEEPGLGKLGSSLPASMAQIEKPSLSICNGGYIVMTSCTTANYINYDGE